MVGTRTITALVGLAIGVAASLVAWYVFDFPFLFLFVPFVPFLFRFGRDDDAGPAIRECPDCGFRTRNPEVAYCPRDGTRLQDRRGDDAPPGPDDRASMK